MAISIQGIKVKSLSLKKREDGQQAISGTYGLMSNADIELAAQGFDSETTYSDRKYAPSAETMTLANQLAASVAKDFNTTLGLV